MATGQGGPIDPAKAIHECRVYWRSEAKFTDDTVTQLDDASRCQCACSVFIAREGVSCYGAKNSLQIIIALRCTLKVKILFEDQELGLKDFDRLSQSFKSAASTQGRKEIFFICLFLFVLVVVVVNFASANSFYG